MGKKLANRLDWNEMLGFEQVTDSRESVSGEARLGTKTGIKPTTIGTKTGTKPLPVMTTIGAKAGIKPVPVQ